MKTVALITEYNPFHNGHALHIKRARELSDADAVVVIMSGNFVQRGTPALLPMHLRAECALNSGADLVVLLPVRYATASAEDFALGAVSIADRLGCVDALCFGSECGDIRLLKQTAEILAKEPEEYRLHLKEALKQGCSFPKAREIALYRYTKEPEIKEIIKEPNNILGIEYIKALLCLESSIMPFTIQRNDQGYHDLTLSGCEYVSASAIRNQMQTDGLTEKLKTYMPDSSYHLLKESESKHFPITADDFSLLLKYRILGEDKNSLCSYADVSLELANRIKNQENRLTTFSSFCDLLKTKELTYSRISRALLHIVLNIKKTDRKSLPSYAKILGFTENGIRLMRRIKENRQIQTSTKWNDLTEDTSEDIFAANLYESIISNKFKTPFHNEYEHPVIRI